MAEDKEVKLFTQEDILRCGCFPGKTYSPVKEGEYVKKDKITFEDLQVDEKAGYMKKTEIKVENAVDKDYFVKKGEAIFDNLKQNEKDAYLRKDEVPKFQLESNKIDDTVSYKELFDKLGGINELKRKFLKKRLQEQKKFYCIECSFDTEEALSFLKEGIAPVGVDILVNEEGKQLDASDIMTKDFIEKIRNYANEAKNNEKKKAIWVVLYDERANEGQGKILNYQTGYDLSKMNEYKVALVLPNALFETK